MYINWCFKLPRKSGIDWNSINAPRDGIHDKFFELAVSAGLNQLVEKPTRGNNILDVVLSGESLTVSNLSVVQPFSNSEVNFTLFIDEDGPLNGNSNTACYKYYD